MDLIIKPTMRCNFACTFCSSNNISKNCKELDNRILYDFILGNDVSRVIVNGGDPLMMPPSYYFDLIKFIEDNNLKTRISLTTNLWDFYKHPDKWIELFKHDRVGVCTSFQYGNERRLASGEVFDENMFKEIFYVFEKLVGYKLMFISVATDQNEDKVLDTVRLAKELGTECKINPALKSGRSEYYYPFYKILNKYLEIIESGLAEWEFNSKEIKALYHNRPTICPYNRSCTKNIRAMSPDGLIHSCGCFNDDHYANMEAGKPTYELGNEQQLLRDHGVLKNECYACDLFDFCNSCFKRIADIKEGGDIGTHCAEMRKLQPRLEGLL